MDNQKIIIGLLCVIVVILIVGVVVFSPAMAKEDSKLTIVDKKVSLGDSFVVQLTDSVGNPISNETIHVKLTDDDGISVNEDITTNSKGKAKFKMEENGKYYAECHFDGGNGYSSSSAAENLTVKKASTELVDEEQTSTTTHSSKYASDGSIYPEYGPEVDAQGITREYAIANNMHYIEMEVDGDRPGEIVTVGGYTAYDPAAGCYHSWGVINGK